MSFCGFLKGNTAATLKLGPFLDSTDGNTAETALTLSQADIRLSKNGGDYAQKNESSSCTHDEIGMYDCAINTTDTNTYGRLRVTVAESGALLVDQTYAVLPEPIYDSFFPAASGDPLPIFGILDWGTAQASASGTLVHRSALNLANDIPNGSIDQIYSGTGAGQTRVVYDFVNSTDTASISPNWVTTPDTTSKYITFGAPPAPTNSAALPSVNVEAIGGDTQSAADLKDFADQGYDPSTNKVQGVVLTDTVTTYTGNTPQTGDSYARIGATGSGLTSLATQVSVNTVDDFLDTEIATLISAVNTIDDFLDTEIAAIKAVTDNLPNSGTLSSLATAASITSLLATLNTSRYLKNTASQKIFFVLVDSTDHVTAKTGVTVTAQRSLDGAAYASCSGTVSEISNGLYYLSTSAADINGDDVVFRFTGTACDPVQLIITTAS